MLRTQPQSRRALHILIALTAFAFITRLVIAVSFENNFDTNWYLQWARGLQDGFFNAYSESRAAAMNLDYPPLWLFPLYFVGALVKIPIVNDYAPYRMLVIKFFPILFDCLVILLLYFFAQKKLRSPQKALIVAGLWAVNPSTIYNCAFWGQTDSILIFFLLLSLWFFDEDMPVGACIVYAIGALMKMQFLYFAPVIFFLLLQNARVKKSLMLFLKGLAAGFGTVLLVFLPFMIGSNNLLLPLKVYFGAMGRYPHINLNAANFYGLFPSLNWTKDSLSIFGGSLNADGIRVGGFSFWTLSQILLVLSIVYVAYYIFKSKKARPFHSALLMIQLIFMLTTRQHERYQLAVTGLALAIYVCSELSDRYLLLYGGLTLTTFLNQFLLLSQVRNGEAPWVGAYGVLLALISALNVLFFFLSLALLLRDWKPAHSKGLFPRRTPESANPSEQNQQEGEPS